MYIYICIYTYVCIHMYVCMFHENTHIIGVISRTHCICMLDYYRSLLQKSPCQETYIFAIET